MADKIYFGITQDWKCVRFAETDITALRENTELKNCHYIFEQYECAKSKSEKNIYHKTRILDTNLQWTAIEYQGAKILNISSEYWISIGSFDINEVKIFWRDHEYHEYDKYLFIYIDYLHWVIKRQESSFKVCFVELKDSLGYKQSVLMPLQFESNFEYLFSLLDELSVYGSFSVFKLIKLLQQIYNFKNLEHEEKMRAKEFFSKVIDPIYKNCKEFHPNAFRDIENLEESYNTVRSLFFD